MGMEMHGKAYVVIQTTGKCLDRGL